MDRREFLKGAAALGALGTAGVAETGCATSGVLAHNASAGASAVPSVDMPSYLVQVDNMMEAIQRGAYFSDLVASAGAGAVPASGVVDTADLDERERLSRKILRTLTLTGMFMDLNPQDRAHPGMQARMWNAAAEFEGTLDDVSGLLTSLTQTERQALRGRLRTEPTLLGRVSTELDSKAADAHAPAKRRRHLRAIMGQVGWRLREQDPSLAIDEFVEAYERAKQTAQRGAQSVEAQGGLTTSGQVTGSATASASSPPAEVVLTPMPVSGTPQMAPEPVAPPPRRQGRGQGLVDAGLITMGISVGVGGIGGLIIAAGEGIGGAIVITVGAVGLIVGLIVLIVGAVANANTPQPAPG